MNENSIEAFTPERETDFVKMKSLRDRNRELTLLVDTSAARISEIRDWYYEIDPISEYTLFFDEHNRTGERQDLEDQITYNFASQEAAAVLVLYAFSDKERNNLDDPLERFINTMVMGEISYSSPSDKINTILDEQQKQTFSVSEVEDLTIAADMLTTIKHPGAHFYNSLSPFIEPTSREAAIRLYETIYTSTLHQEEMNDQDKIKSHKLAKLEATRQLLSLKFSNLSPENLSDEEREELLSYLDFIKGETTGENRIQHMSTSAQSTKGFIHETLWVVDAVYLSMIKNEAYIVRPSVRRQDRPIVDRPTLNRGFDVIVFNNNNCVPVQLKTSRYKNQYHPLISVKREIGFDENDHSTIKNKLDGISASIRNPQGKAQIDQNMKNIFPTVHEIFEECAKDPTVHSLGRIAL